MTVPELKKLLRAEVCRLFKQDDRLWKRPIVEMLRELRESGFQAVVFGGTLRSLLYSRLYECRPGRPRDVDLVVRGASLRDVEKRFGEYLARRTRYGGLCLKREGWQFDVWPVGDTWAFRHENYRDAGFAELPFTTPFNLEAIAVEAWPCVGRPRQVFSGDDQFFEGIVSRIVELNCTDNPYPALTVVRGLVLATDLGYRVGPRLADYIVAYGSSMTESQFAEQQLVSCPNGADISSGACVRLSCGVQSERCSPGSRRRSWSRRRVRAARVVRSVELVNGGLEGADAAMHATSEASWSARRTSAQ